MTRRFVVAGLVTLLVACGALKVCELQYREFQNTSAYLSDLQEQVDALAKP